MMSLESFLSYIKALLNPSDKCMKSVAELILVSRIAGLTLKLVKVDPNLRSVSDIIEVVRVGFSFLFPVPQFGNRRSSLVFAFSGLSKFYLDTVLVLAHNLMVSVSIATLSS
jgi:uncharacterized membrane protein YkgB